MMRKLMTAALAVLAIGGTAVATSANARDWDDHGGWREGWRDHDGWRDHGGWGWRGWGWRAGYYHPYYGGCATHWRWSPYWGRYVRQTVCY